MYCSDFYPYYYFEAEKFAPCCENKNDPEAVAETTDCEGKSKCENIKSQPLATIE